MQEKLSPEQLTQLSNADLAQISQQVTGRLNNQDWQRIILELKASGHIHTFQESAPPLLRRYLKLEIDLDEELAKGGFNSPLMSNLGFDPRRPRGDEDRVLANLSTQDGGASMQFEIEPDSRQTAISFGVKSMLTLKFKLPGLDQDECYAFLDQLRRDAGLSFLWTPERWDRDYLLFIKGEFFTRVYAFSPHFEAASMLTNDLAGSLTDWLEKAWFPRTRQRRSKRGTQMLSALNAAEIAAPPPPPPTAAAPSLPAPSPFSEEDLTALISKLIQLDVAGRGGLISVAGDKVEVLGRIFSAPSQEAILAELRAHPDLTEKILARLAAKAPSTPPNTPASSPPPPSPPKDPLLDTW